MTFTARLTSTYDDWHTPFFVIDIAREVLGQIDLDPASNDLANNYIRATQIYTTQSNGLLRDWTGNVFLNPPGGKTGGDSNAAMWWQKSLTQFDKGNIDSLFYVAFSIEQVCQNPTMLDYPICFFRKRLRFIRGNKDKPTHGNAAVLLTRNADKKQKFQQLLLEHGKVLNVS